MTHSLGTTRRSTRTLTLLAAAMTLVLARPALSAAMHDPSDSVTPQQQQSVMDVTPDLGPKYIHLRHTQQPSTTREPGVSSSSTRDALIITASVAVATAMGAALLVLRRRSRNGVQPLPGETEASR
jgi:hypothetical protein